MGNTLQAVAEPEAQPENESHTIDLKGSLALPVTNADIERVEAELLKMEQVDVPVTHRFAPGVYMREVIMPAGAFIIGHEHTTEHLNIVTSGRASVLMGGELLYITGPCTFVSKPGVRKVLYIHEEMRWATIHPTEETNLEKLDEQLIIKSQSFNEHQALADVERLKELIKPKEAAWLG